MNLLRFASSRVLPVAMMLSLGAGCGGAAAHANSSPPEPASMAAGEASPESPPPPSQMPAGAMMKESVAGQPAVVATPKPQFNTESYSRIVDNAFLDVTNNPLSTFGIDVDTASYSNVRRFLLAQHALPPKDSVRIEELINYFRYNYPQPTGAVPFSVTTDAAGCPWDSTHRLVRIGLQGKRIDPSTMPPRNLVFLLDVSGSMEDPNKLPLVKIAMRMLADQLGDKDTVSIAVYAGSEGLALAPTPGHRKQTIIEALTNLQAGGSTNGGAGIQLAYKVARDNFKKGGINRVILATDGDFNVGLSNPADLERLVEDQRKTGIFLSVLGFGTGNTKDSTMEQLADKGNGNYAYIDTPQEAKKVLVEQAGGTLVTIAKDVKLQVEFNPSKVQAYRLIGYENRVMAAEDFRNDQKDSGDLGAGHSVTALYEIVPPGAPFPGGKVDPLRYQKPTGTTTAAGGNELMFVKLRYKEPQADVSKELSFPVADSDKSLDQASPDFRFASSVAAFAMLVRESQYKGNATWSTVRTMAQGALGDDPGGYRAEFVRMVTEAERLSGGGAVMVK